MIERNWLTEELCHKLDLAGGAIGFTSRFLGEIPDFYYWRDWENEWRSVCYEFASGHRHSGDVTFGSGFAKKEEGRESRRNRLSSLFYNGSSFFTHWICYDGCVLFGGDAV